MSLPARFFGIITSPKSTYESVVAHPRWFGMMALTTVLMAVLIGGFLMTKVGRDAWLDAAVSSPMSGEVTDQQYQGMEKMSAYVGYITMVSMVVFVPLITAVLAGLLFAVFNAALGGDATFKQVLTVVAHGGPIGVLVQLFTVPLNYMRGSMSSSTNLGVLTQAMLDDSSFLARFLGIIDVFVIWQLIVLAMGLAVLYRRRTQPIATSLLVVYVVIAIVVAFVKRGAAA
jgi:hypothetical protein